VKVEIKYPFKFDCAPFLLMALMSDLVLMTGRVVDRNVDLPRRGVDAQERAADWSHAAFLVASDFCPFPNLRLDSFALKMEANTVVEHLQAEISHFSENCQSEAGTPIKRRKVADDATEFEPIKEDNRDNAHLGAILQVAQARANEGSTGRPSNEFGDQRTLPNQLMMDTKSEQKFGQHNLLSMITATESTFEAGECRNLSATANEAPESNPHCKSQFLIDQQEPKPLESNLNCSSLESHHLPMGDSCISVGLIPNVCTESTAQHLPESNSTEFGKKIEAAHCENPLPSIIDGFILHSFAASQSNVLGQHQLNRENDGSIGTRSAVVTETQHSTSETPDSNSQKWNPHYKSQFLIDQQKPKPLESNLNCSSLESHHLPMGDSCISVGLIPNVCTESTAQHLPESNSNPLASIIDDFILHSFAASQSNVLGQHQLNRENDGSIGTSPAVVTETQHSTSETPDSNSQKLADQACLSVQTDSSCSSGSPNLVIDCTCVPTESIPIPSDAAVACVLAGLDSPASKDYLPTSATDTNGPDAHVPPLLMPSKNNAQVDSPVTMKRPLVRSLHAISSVPVISRPERIQAQLNLAAFSKDDAGAIAAVKDMIGLTVAGESFGMSLELFFGAIELGINLDISFLCRDLLKMVLSTNNPEKLVSFFNAAIQIDEQLLQSSHCAPFRNLCGGTVKTKSKTRTYYFATFLLFDLLVF